MAKGNSPAPAAQAAAPAVPSITQLSLYTSAFGTADGYGNSAEQIALALERRGVTITLSGPTRPTGYSNADHIKTRQPTPAQAIVWYSIPGFWERQMQKRPSYGFSMYEADQLPKEWTARLHNVDEVWVPCKANGELFAACTSRPVHVIPLGVDAEAFQFKKRVRGDKLRFLFAATYANEVRKNAAGAISAFIAAFPGRDDVELVVRTTHGIIESADPRVRVINGLRTTGALADIYRSFDALVAPSYGEGFGLIPLEAMCTGMPAIFADALGMSDYADLGLPVKARKVPALAGHGSQPYGNWHEPHMDEFVDRMREVDQHYDRIMDMAEKDAATIARVWTWDRTAELIQKRLEA